MSQAVYLNRNLPDNLELTRRLVAHKLPVIVEPLITIDYLPFEQPIVDKNTAIIATSRYGLFGLLKTCPTINRKTRVFCVGGATAEAAKNLGFKNIITGPGNAFELTAQIKALGNNEDRFVYARGEDISFPLEESLSDLPQSFLAIITYVAKARLSFTKRLVDKLKNQEIGASVFYSARTAKIFLNLILQHELLSILEEMTLVCISNNVAEAFEKHSLKKIIPQDFSSETVAQAINNLFSSDSS